jgi:hypothetical protein
MNMKASSELLQRLEAALNDVDDLSEQVSLDAAVDAFSILLVLDPAGMRDWLIENGHEFLPLYRKRFFALIPGLLQ